MAALTDLSDVINRMTGGNNGTPRQPFFYKTARVQGATASTAVAGRQFTLWRHDGVPGGGTVATAAAIPTNATLGALPFTDPGGGRESHLISAMITSSVLATFLLYDRLFHVGGLSGASTAEQTVQGDPASPALTRNTGGVGNFVFYEVQTLIGTASRTLTMTYTNQDGTPGRTSTINIGGTGYREVYRAQTIPLASGDTGVRAVEKVQLSATTGTAGDIAIVIGKPIAFLSVTAVGTAGWRDFTTGLPGIPTIPAGACLALLTVPTSTVLPELTGTMTTIEK